MKNKMWLIISLGFVGVMLLYFVLNPSYQKSIEARVYFTMGNYEEAYTLANEAFSENAYNRMASTVMAQSKTALIYVNYIKEAKKYMDQISAIAKSVDGKGISDADKAKMKIMSEIMIEQYKKISPSVITDKDLINDAKHYNEQFQELHDNLSQ